MTVIGPFCIFGIGLSHSRAFPLIECLFSFLDVWLRDWCEIELPKAGACGADCGVNYTERRRVHPLEECSIYQVKFFLFEISGQLEFGLKEKEGEKGSSEVPPWGSTPIG